MADTILSAWDSFDRVDLSLALFVRIFVSEMDLGFGYRDLKRQSEAWLGLETFAFEQNFPGNRVFPRQHAKKRSDTGILHTLNYLLPEHIVDPQNECHRTMLRVHLRHDGYVRHYERY
jgi:hypothetical protein